MHNTLTSRAPARPTIRLTLATALVAAVAVIPSATASAAAPPNDSFTTPTALELDAPIAVDTRDATNTDVEDLLAKDLCGSPPFGSPAPPDNTVWWSFTNAGLEPERILVSAAPPTFITPGFNVIVDLGAGWECVGGGPVEAVFIAEPGLTYYIQSIDDQIPPDWDGDPANLDTTGGGDLVVTATSLGVPLPEICPGLALDDPNIPPGLNLILGTEGDDEIRGTRGDDLIVGLGGDDEIDGRSGNDVIFGCDGDDEISGGNGDDIIFGDNPIFGDPAATGGDDEVDGGNGNDVVWGGPGDDELSGGGGDDEVHGQLGDDEVDGDNGNDFVVGGRDNDEVDGGRGNDEVFGGPGSDELNGGLGDDLVSGDSTAPPPFNIDESPHTDECEGGGGNDIIEFCENSDDD